MDRKRGFGGEELPLRRGLNPTAFRGVMAMDPFDHKEDFMSRIVRGVALAALLGVLVFVVVSLVATDEAVAAKGGKGGSTCPRQGIYCLDVWNPVICSDGNVYSNSCYAYVACATGCVPYGAK